MFRVTQNAATALAEARKSMGKPDDYGVRFFVDRTDAAAAMVGFDFVAEPEPDDEVSRESTIPVFVAPDASSTIGDATLDASTQSGTPRLVLRR